MTRSLVAITYHNQQRSTIWKTWRSRPRLSDASTIVFCYDKKPDIDECILTNEETLGGKRNFAINYARANGYDLIAFLDDDDLFGPSWIKALLELKPEPKKIYHPQWNILFAMDRFWAREHIGSNDPRCDSRDALLNNPWSALCAFDPMTIDVKYNAHKVTDPRESFEDWSFNLDTLAAGYEHVSLPNTFHFLRIRENSLGKATGKCGLKHTQFFLDRDLRNAHHATEERFQSKYDIDLAATRAEFDAIHKIEPQIYYWGQKVNVEIKGKVEEVDFEQEHYARCQIVSDAVDALGDFRGMRDVFWTIDHFRIGGAEKALDFASRFLSRFPLGAPARQLWIDDIVAAKVGKDTIAPVAWVAALRNVLKAWQDEPGSQARSIHICNSFMGWQAITFNPALFDKVQVYLYVFNDDLRFQSEAFEPHTKGYHSPLYRFAHMIDRPNFHIITDSQHFARRIHKKTGLGDRIRIIQIPVMPQESKRKEKPDGHIDILWAGRMDHWKGLDVVSDIALLLDKSKYTIHVWGDGPLDLSPKFYVGCGMKHGPYKSFEYIKGKYDFMLFTSEREGMPNVVKEAMASGLQVLFTDTEDKTWSKELPSIHHVNRNAEDVARTIEAYADKLSMEIILPKFTFEDAEPAALNAYKEALCFRP